MYFSPINLIEISPTDFVKAITENYLAMGCGIWNFPYLDCQGAAIKSNIKKPQCYRLDFANLLGGLENDPCDNSSSNLPSEKQEVITKIYEIPRAPHTGRQNNVYAANRDISRVTKKES